MKTIKALKDACKAVGKAIKADYRKAKRVIEATAKDYFAMYAVRDNYGTYILCWTMKDAEHWLKHCAPHAEIVETYDYRVLVRRMQYV